MLISCSSQKQDFKIIESYIQSEIRGTKYDTVFMRAETVTKRDLVSTYERMYQNKEHITIEPDGFNDWPFDDIEISETKSGLNKTNESWEEFSANNIKVIPSEVLASESFFRKHMRDNNLLVYSSKPVYNNDKTKAIFYVSGGSFLNHNYIFGGVIVYEKKNGKWEMAAKLQEEIYR